MIKFFTFIFILLFLANEAYSNNIKNLGYKEFLESVLTNNNNINDKKLEWEIAKQEALNNYHEYDLKYTYRIGIERNQTPYTASESQSAALLGLTTEESLSYYGERNENAAVGLEKKIRTGGLFKISGSVINLDNTKQVGTAINNETKGFIGMSLSQPLLKGKGPYSESEVRISLSNIEKDIRYQSYRKVITDTVRDASDVYWSLYLAQEKLEIREKSVSLMRRILKDTRTKIKEGYSAPLNYNSVTTAMIRRELQMSEAKRFVLEQSSIASQLLASTIINSKIKAQDMLFFQKERYSPDLSLSSALKTNPNIVSLKLKSQQEKIRINYEKNKKLPQLDLNLSYGKNSLSNETSSLIGNNHDSWYVGLEFSTPITTRSLQGSQRVARLREIRIMSLLKNKEHEVRNRVLSITQQLDIINRDISRNKNILKQEKHIYNAFSIEKKSGDRALNSLLQQELELNRAKEDLVTAKVSYHRLLISLWAEEGTLLSKFGLE